MSKHKRSAERQCEYCGKTFMAYPSGQKTAALLFPILRLFRSCTRNPQASRRQTSQATSEESLSPMRQSLLSQANGTFVGQSKVLLEKVQCSVSIPRSGGGQDVHGANVAWWKWLGGNKASRSSRAHETQKSNVRYPEIKERVRQALIGRTFLSRGGNGQITSQQAALCQALGLSELAMEFVRFPRPRQSPISNRCLQPTKWT